MKTAKNNTTITTTTTTTSPPRKRNFVDTSTITATAKYNYNYTTTATTSLSGLRITSTSDDDDDDDDASNNNHNGGGGIRRLERTNHQHDETIHHPISATAAAAPKSGDTYNIAELARAELLELYHQQRHQQQQQPSSSSSSSSPPQSSACSFPTACRTLLHELDGNGSCVDCGTSAPEWACILYGSLVCIQCSGKHRSMGVQTSKVASVTMDHWTYGDIIKMLEGGNRQLATFYARHKLCTSTIEDSNGGSDDNNNNNNNKTTKASPPRPTSTSSSPTSSSSSSSSSSSTTSATLPPSTSAAVASSSSSSSRSGGGIQLTKENVVTMRYRTKAALFYRQQLDRHVQHILAQGPYRGRKRPNGGSSSSGGPKRRPLGRSTSTVD